MSDSDEGTPKPGHFLPGGSDEPAAGSRPLTLRSSPPGGLGKARSVALEDSPVRRKARPIPTEPGTTSEYSGPPVAPLTGVPAQPLTGTRRVGGPRSTGWHKNPSRGVPQFSSEPPPVKPPRHYSHRVIAGLSVIVLVMLTGATVAGFKLIDSYDTRVDNPLSQPSVKKSQAPLPVPPDPTVTVTATTVPDLQRLRQNEVYKAGTVAAVSCKEPAIKPDSQSAILRYYKALLPCLDKAWAPVIKRSGYEFRSPKVQLQTKQPNSTTGCTGEEDVAYYCDADESINISWKNDLKFYKDDPVAARVWMMDTMAHEYGHHVQNMTEMLTAAWSREGWAKTKTEELEWTRRKELQATCFGAAFLGANKRSLGLSGEKLRLWQWEAQHSGDEYNPKKVRDHGSRKSNWAWSEPAFKSTNPASCNTFTASAAKVS
ncbi:neutral zinc metallopeptidase [Kribbella sp. NPDC051586]|uniref:neutral zinc metallopeptidase n=1 Tax=Kribbella sp. NPDC051586 TaxID=3364118 RepID=UPI00378C2010